jgi:hypothetical protein
VFNNYLDIITCVLAEADTVRVSPLCLQGINGDFVNCAVICDFDESSQKAQVSRNFAVKIVRKTVMTTRGVGSFFRFGNLKLYNQGCGP